MNKKARVELIYFERQQPHLLRTGSTSYYNEINMEDSGQS